MAFYYKYDEKKRLIERKLPGKEVEFFVYNKADQLVLYQDGNYRKIEKTIPNHEWAFTKYDALGRIIITGKTFLYKEESREEMQAISDQYDIIMKFWI